MRSSSRQSESVLTHFVPAEVLRQARALAQEFRRDEQFRQFMSRNAVLFMPPQFLLIVVAGICASAPLVFVFSNEAFFSKARWLFLTLFATAIPLFLAAVVTLLYFFLLYVEHRGIRAKAIDGPAKLPSRKAYLALGAFVGAPLVLLGLVSPAFPFIVVAIVLAVFSIWSLVS